MSLILKNKKGKVIEKCGYDEEEGNIFYIFRLIKK